jgi:hypothetical protein
LLDRPSVFGKGGVRILSSSSKFYRVNPPPIGIRPAVTISSNFVAATPRYSAAWTRERPRAANERGRLLAVFRPIALFPHFGVAIVPIRNLFKIDPIEPRMDG